ncbi:MAG: DUF6259 domain-containing protein [Anaerolineae bacterium]|nr:DUF6259 domain-containing protein [Thermoflexales bacterium]MDW8407821.1 DUF6259 domain-containing protein [Anaerolineae bacterium]
MLQINETTLHVETHTLKATFERGILTELIDKTAGQQLVGRQWTETRAEQRPALELIYAGGERAPLGTEPGDQVTLIPMGEQRADFRVSAWNGDGVISVRADPQSNELIVEPSGYASRPGLRACRWTLGGINPTLKLAAPLWQGVRLALDDPLIHQQHFPWPFEWQAGLAILDDEAGNGFWIHCQDVQYRYKALHVGDAGDAHSLSFDTESYGPLDGNLAAGGLTWRINTYTGGWQQPAAQYRDWLERAYRPERTPRPAWFNEVRFAISWCPCDPTILDALARRLDPRTVLLHIPNWRTDGYDQNYPTYIASEAGRAFIEKAQAMGFRAMPHFNSVDMDPTHPAYTYVRDFGFREVDSKRLQGWTWTEQGIKPLQESNATRLRHQDKYTMVKIHPGLSTWRSILAENVRQAVETHDLELVFLDVTLCTWNLHNCLVENMTPTQGMQRLIEEVAAIKPRLAVGGEGRNETSMTGQAFSQVHLFRSSHRSIDGLERTGGCALNEFLFGKWSRSFGYWGLTGGTEDESLRMRLHISLGAIPTVCIASAAEIEHPNTAVAEMLDLAGGR